MARKGRVQKKEERRYNALKLGSPFLVFFVGLGLLALFYPWNEFLIIFALIFAYMVPPAGKETIIPVGIFIWEINWIVVSLVISFMDIVTALFFVWNFDYAKRIPVLGKWIKNFERENGNIMCEKKWLQGMAYLGLVFFVFVPLQGTEGVGGSVLGRILGMKPWTVFSAVVIGSLLGSFVTAYIALTVGTALLDTITSTTSRIIIAVILLMAFATVSYLLWRYRKKKKSMRSKGDEEE